MLLLFVAICVLVSHKISKTLQWSDEQIALHILGDICSNQQNNYLNHKEYIGLDHMYLGYISKKYDLWKLDNPVVRGNRFQLKNFDFQGFLSHDKKRYLVVAKAINNPARVIFITQDSYPGSPGNPGETFKFFYGTPTTLDELDRGPGER